MCAAWHPGTFGVFAGRPAWLRSDETMLLGMTTMAYLQRVDDLIAGFGGTEEGSCEGTGVKAYSAIHVYFLARLRRLEGMRCQMDSLPARDPFTKKLIDHGLFATYRECMDEGVGSEARRILNI